jgi:uncharacterized protein YlaN (UPF0358 family)
MRRFIPFLFLLLPVALFAQSPREQETAMLKKIGLNESQAAQVLDIQGKTQTTIKQDAVQIRLLHAQMEKALLPASPNMQEVNGYVSQIAQTQADMMKAFVSARVQLRQIIGDDGFPVYARFNMRGYGKGMGSDRAGAGGMMGGDWEMMGGTGIGGGMMGAGGGMMGGGGMMSGDGPRDNDQF